MNGDVNVRYDYESFSSALLKTDRFQVNRVKYSNTIKNA